MMQTWHDGCIRRSARGASVVGDVESDGVSRLFLHGWHKKPMGQCNRRRMGEQIEQRQGGEGIAL